MVGNLDFNMWFIKSWICGFLRLEIGVFLYFRGVMYVGVILIFISFFEVIKVFDGLNCFFIYFIGVWCRDLEFLFFCKFMDVVVWEGYIVSNIFIWSIDGFYVSNNRVSCFVF